MKLSRQVAFRSRTTQGLEALSMNVASVALGIEALEKLLIDKGVLKDDELMQYLEKMVKEKSEPSESRIVCPT